MGLQSFPLLGRCCTLQHQIPDTLLTGSEERPPQAEQDFHLLDLDQFFPSLEIDWCIDPFPPIISDSSQLHNPPYH